MTTMPLRPLLEWEQAQPLIAAAIAREGCQSLTSYGDSFPQADLLDLACVVGIAGVHSGHLAMGLWEEAAIAGTLARCARGLLVRAICTAFRDWEDSRGSRVRYLEDALHQWGSQLPANYHDVAEEIRAVMLIVPPPEDWIPHNSDDSILVSLFDQHWPVQQAGSRYRITSDDAGGLTIEDEHHMEPSARPISPASAPAHAVRLRPEGA
ncbi:MAG: hypothetical protein E6J90_14330 [Deltaproteobacteria bacterium]|nr:MAG: hypothetical protein E6J90_14330 [Deltaproteobacteria bacterium]